MWYEWDLGSSCCVITYSLSCACFDHVGTNVENVNYRVTKESLTERLNTDMRAASVSISKECRYGNYFRHYDPHVSTPN